MSKSEEKRNEGRSNVLDKSMCKCSWVFLLFTYQISSTQFSPHFGEKTFWWTQRENTWTPPSFSSLSLPVKHFPKCFLSSFSLLPKIYSTKHTLRSGKKNKDIKISIKFPLSSIVFIKLKFKKKKSINVFIRYCNRKKFNFSCRTLHNALFCRLSTLAFILKTAF